MRCIYVWKFESIQFRIDPDVKKSRIAETKSTSLAKNLKVLIKLCFLTPTGQRYRDAGLKLESDEPTICNTVGAKWKIISNELIYNWNLDVIFD